ncbi:MAG: ABC transporter permease [Oscillospiraceae bacterium]
MGIVLKHTLKNIFKRPGRTFLLVFCIFLCSISASLCLDMTGSVRRLFSNYFTDLAGSTDIEFINLTSIDEEIFEELPENRYLLLSSAATPFYRRDPQMYSFAVETDVSIFCTDLKKAYEMQVLLTELDLTENETAMTIELAELLGYSVGDTIEFYDNLGEKQEFTIKQLVERGGFITGRDICIISPEGMERLTYGETPYLEAFIDFIDDKDADIAEEYLKEHYPEAEVFNIRYNEDIDEAVNQISSLFYTMFAVCLLVVIIITVTVAERIMSERMAVVGTLRSLGISQSMTAFILMLENILYALMGSIPGIIVYEAIREPFLNVMFVSDTDSLDFGTMSIGVKIAVIIGAAVLESACTIKEIIAASRTAIRDIIFLNKDTEFRFSKVKTIIGTTALAAGIVLAFVKNSAAASIVCFVALVLGIYLMFPYVSVYGARLFEAVFEKSGMPVARLAAAEAGTKKSTIASGALIAAASSVCMLLFIFSDSLYGLFSGETFDTDVVMLGTSKEDFLYDYIDDLEGVTSSENVYYMPYSYLEVNGKEMKNIAVFGDDYDPANGARQFSAVEGMPETAVGDDEFYCSKTFADETGIAIGDTVELNVNTNSFIPRKLTLKLSGYINTVHFDPTGKGVMLSRENYIACNSDVPMYILIRCEEGYADKLVDSISKYSSGTTDEVKTYTAYVEQTQKENASETAMIKMLGFIGLALTFVGVVSNQLIGFESRKRENAVLMSVAMDRSKLKRMLLIETIISSILPIIVSVPLGMLLSLPIKSIMYSIGTELPLVFDIPELLGLTVILLIVFSFTVLFPYKSLRKMKLSEQLKYE